MPLTAATALLAIEQLAVTAWVGGLWITGLILAPTLFAHFDRQLAGDIAGQLFSATSQLGLSCGLVLWGLAAYRARTRPWRDWRLGILTLMLVLVLIGEFGIAERMRELKALARLADVQGSLGPEFGRLHGVASVLYLAECILGAVLVVAGIRPRTSIHAGS